ncbi:hypothetical protein MLD52_09525 [Puniceicoccaceae bacterium K14]|nr:hypothetical protein [Puniceicoccaceae bacterium K14]
MAHSKPKHEKTNVELSNRSLKKIEKETRNLQLEIYKREYETLLSIVDKCDFRSKREAVLWALSIINTIVTEIENHNEDIRFGFLRKTSGSEEFSQIILPWLGHLKVATKNSH